MAKKVKKETVKNPAKKNDTSFKAGNKEWRKRSKHGRDKLFATPGLLWDAACEYFQWCDDNPLLESKAFSTKDDGIVDHPLAKMRAFTIAGLCYFLGCNRGYFVDFKKRLTDDDADFSLVIKSIEDIIYTQKFEGAAAGLLNSNIIARDLGLSDKTEVKDTSDKDLDLSDFSAEEKKTLRTLLARAGSGD